MLIQAATGVWGARCCLFCGGGGPYNKGYALDPLWAFGRKRLWHALVGREKELLRLRRLFSRLARRYRTLIGAAFGDLLPTCLTSRQAVVGQLYNRKRKPKHWRWLVVAICCASPFLLLSPRLHCPFSALTNNKNNNKNRTLAHFSQPEHTHTLDRRTIHHGDRVGVWLILLLPLLPPMHYKRAPEIIFPRTHRHTRAHGNRGTHRSFPLLTGGGHTHLFRRWQHTAHTHTRTHTYGLECLDA